MRFKKIQTKLFTAMMVTSLIPIGIVSAILLLLISQTVNNEVSVTTSRTAVDMQEKIDEYFGNLGNGVYNIYYNTKLLNALNNDNQQPTDGTPPYDPTPDTYQFFTSLYNYSKIKDILGIYLFDQKGDLVHYFTPSASFVSKTQYANIYTKDAQITDSKPLVNIMYNNIYTANILHYAQPILLHGETLIGLVGIDLKLQPFQALVEKYNLFSGSKVIIADQKDTIIYDTDTNKIGKAYNNEIQGNQRIIEKPLSFQNWKLIYIYQINPQTLIIRNIAFAVMLISFLLVTVLSFTLSHSITRPLKKLVGAMKQMEVGNFTRRVAVNGQDEVSLLGAHFNRMSQRIEQLIDEEYKSQIIRKEAELKALHIQINPHFLYNTLQTMGSIASLKNAPEIKTMCKALGNMFRYSIQMRNDWVTVKEELSHVRNYLIILNKRYGNVLRVRLIVEEGAYNHVIPKLIFQPILENCIEHGLIPSDRSSKLLKLTVKTDPSCGILTVDILDNGVGIPPVKLEKLIEELQRLQLSPPWHKDHSIGLLNVQMRIRMLCGNEYGLSVSSRAAVGTRVVIRLPLRRGLEHV